MAVNNKITVFWGVEPYSLVYTISYQRYVGNVSIRTQQKPEQPSLNNHHTENILKISNYFSV
jgi:hypothetical protein